MDVTECENCGGKVVFDAAPAVVRCLFCGDISLEVSTLEAIPLPRHAVPFSLSADDARGLFRRWARSSFWAPAALRDQHADVAALWVPAWRVTADVHASWTGLVSAHTKSGRRPESGVQRSRREAWIPASLGLSSAELAALAPFGDEHTQTWSPGSEPYEVAGLSSEAAMQQARSAFETQAQRGLIREYRLRDCRVSVRLEDARCQARMVPVYIGCVRYRDRPWRFVINGQTGRVCGRTPLDRTKVAVAVTLLVLVALAWLWWSAP